ncbi:PIG-L deacetylase family protein [Prosthecobacter vanneervenii]|uniref:LmbE family N-acetylglucosaminyl deacetylase n=1 Tax=Prosthecobacter vanneervenii TaxID=48466 RepID=A0A7W8DIQ3_9BACT|nr:PIG-L family deacetylase [Prosthecobacter vanneervenii]MBB5031354.1 LmbE family N-acetylglucosaminyl deacetylase [Prosthecobacter vanneervenii]
MPASTTLTAQDRVLVFAPHPDDEALGCGGLIQHAVAAGAQVRVIFQTDGDNNPWPQRYVEQRWSIDDDCRRRWGARRRQEALRSVQTLGLRAEDAIFYGLPDQGLTRLWMQQDARTLDLHVADLQNFRPTLLVVPSQDDNHPDHGGSYELVQEARKRAGLTAVRQWDYLIHRRWFCPEASGLTLNLTLQQKARKLAAIECHETQLYLSSTRFCAYARDEEIFIPNPYA